MFAEGRDIAEINSFLKKVWIEYCVGILEHTEGFIGQRSRTEHSPSLYRRAVAEKFGGAGLGRCPLFI
jgi:hypothetical protein